MTAHPLAARDEISDLHDPILKRYRHEVQDVFGDLSIQGLPETRYDIGRLRLDQIFVHLRLNLRWQPTELNELLQGPSYRRKYAVIRAYLNRLAHGDAEGVTRDLERWIQDVRFTPQDLHHATAEAADLIVEGPPGSGAVRWHEFKFAPGAREELNRLKRLLEDMKVSRETTKSKPVDLAEAMAEARHLVIVGAPGAAKRP